LANSRKSQNDNYKRKRNDRNKLVSRMSKPVNGIQLWPSLRHAKARREARMKRRAQRPVQRRVRQRRQFRGRRAVAPKNGCYMKMELKFHDVDLDDAVIANTGTITDSINKIAQGVGECQRIGRKCCITNINWRFKITLPATTDETNTSDTVRVIVYIDKQCNGAAATVLGILESTNYLSFNNLANKSRFRTLMDRTYDLISRSGGTSAAGVDQFGEFVISDTFFKRVAISLEFDDINGAITEIRSNNVGVLLLSSAGICLFNSKFRLRFSDG